MKIFITGGLGYVGGRLANFLHQNQPGAELILTTTRETCPSWTKNFKVERMNLAEEDSIVQSIRDHKPETIIHLAARDKIQCEENPELANEININGTERLLNIGSEHSVKRFIYFSTFQVYGNLVGEITEENPLDPQNQYAITKVESEKIIHSFDQQKVQTLIFRLSNGYGYPKDSDVAANVWGLVFNSFCKQAVEHQRISIRSNQYRDFITLEDVARAVEHFLFNRSDWGDGVFNLGGDCCISVLDVAQRVVEVYQKHCQATASIESPGGEEYNSFIYNVSKLKKAGFQLNSNLENEVLQTLLQCEIAMDQEVI